MRFRTALVGLGTGLVMVLSACGNGPPPESGSAGGGGGGGGAGGALQATTGGTAAKTINETDGLKFDPATASVKVGDVVEWDNGGSAAHNVTFDAVHSETMNSGDKYQVKFTAAGSYAFKCTFHAGMEGTITVA